MSTGRISHLYKKRSGRARGLTTVGISDGADNGKCWSRRWISRTDTPLVPGDQFEERTAYVLFRCSREKPLEDFFNWERQIRKRFGTPASTAARGQIALELANAIQAPDY